MTVSHPCEVIVTHPYHDKLDQALELEFLVHYTYPYLVVRLQAVMLETTPDMPLVSPTKAG